MMEELLRQDSATASSAASVPGVMAVAVMALRNAVIGQLAADHRERVSRA
ncbi:hypothetical protein [Micromonospora sp. CPCC 206061]